MSTKKHFSGLRFIILGLIFNGLAFSSFWAAMDKDEGSLGDNAFINAFANAFPGFRFPLGFILPQSVEQEHLFMVLFINAVLYAFVIEFIIHYLVGRRRRKND